MIRARSPVQCPTASRRTARSGLAWLDCSMSLPRGGARCRLRVDDDRLVLPYSGGGIDAVGSGAGQGGGLGEVGRQLGRHGR